MQPWKYAIVHLVYLGGVPVTNISYITDGDVKNEDIPPATLLPTIGRLGGEGWELVSVNNGVTPTGDPYTNYHFKQQA